MSSANLDLLTLFPSQDHNYILILFNYTEVIRLGTCCRLLKDIIQNDKVFWKELYKQDFLSGAYQKKE